ncbi:hypothetical protein lerEdw1_019393 [Lerista edwardsae]|nr:hypothetical protein lerEdw1_019393 [Lerista edwardsae]
MVLELYLDLLSQPCRAVYIFAKKNNVPFMMKNIDMLKGREGAGLGGRDTPHRTRPVRQQFSEEFNKVNYLRKVPVLKDGDYILEESTAILLYLTRKYNTPSHWYPPDMKQRGRVDEYLAWQHTTIRANASKILWLKVVIPLFLGMQVPVEKVQEAVEDLNASLKKLEEKFLQEKPFIIGTEISLADLVAVVELMQAFAGGVDVFEERPRLLDWRKRIEASVGRELFHEAHARVLNDKELRNIQVDPALKAQLKPMLLRMVKS